jgi:hypothetical protein
LRSSLEGAAIEEHMHVEESIGYIFESIEKGNE